MAKNRKNKKKPNKEPDEGSTNPRTARGPDESRKGPRKDSKPLQSDSSSLRQSPSPDLSAMRVDDILRSVRRRWEIQQRLHLPLHLDGCMDCKCFAYHVADCCRGGLEQFNQIQRNHWIQELEHELDCVYEEGYDKARDKALACKRELQKQIEDLGRKIQDLEIEQDNSCSDNTHHERADVRPMAISPPPPLPRQEHKRTHPLSFDDQTKMGENPSKGKKPKASDRTLVE